MIVLTIPGIRDVWAGLQRKEASNKNGSSLTPRRIFSLPRYRPNDAQYFSLPSPSLEDDWVPGTAGEKSSGDLFTSPGTPGNSDSSRSSGSEDDYSIPQAVNEQSRCCPCCCRIFAKDFYLFGHLKRSKKCKMLCGERGCERPIEGMHEMLMCYNSRHRFHCQKCGRRFKSWGGLHKHLLSSRDCFKNINYKFKSRNVGKPQDSNYKPARGPVSRSTVDITPEVYLPNEGHLLATPAVPAPRRTVPLERSNVGQETKNRLPKYMGSVEQNSNEGELRTLDKT